MNCPECKDQLAGFIEGLLDFPTAKEIESHLADCSVCQGEYEDILRIQVRLLRDGGSTAGVSLEDKVMNQIISQQTKKLRRIKMRKLYKLIGTGAAIAAVVLILITAGWNLFGNGDAQKVFAAAINSFIESGTFSCVRTVEYTGEYGEKFIDKHLIMFKEPDRERWEVLSNTKYPQVDGNVDITNYAKRLQLRYRPSDKTAVLSDLSASFGINPGTGKTNLTNLSTEMRDKLLKWSNADAEDLGMVELDGKSVRLLKSQRKKYIFTIWIDPETRLPVQIILDQTDGQRWMYEDIQIDIELDDNLFSLEPPEGYTLHKAGKNPKGEIMAKMKHLVLNCIIYRDKSNNQWPEKVEDLIDTVLSAEALKTMLAAPGDPDGPAIIRYRKPPGIADASKEVLFYEVYDEWPESGGCFGIMDGHVERVADQKSYEERIK